MRWQLVPIRLSKMLISTHIHRKEYGVIRFQIKYDYRRTQNLECFLKRKGADLPITDNPNDYKSDLVFWADIGIWPCRNCCRSIHK